MARRAPIAVVIKRGPAGWTQLALWDTRTDTFTKGAWLRARVYEEKCDVSPDGELFVYSAFQGSRLGTSYSDSYTAVSRPPWFHALALWPMHGTYGGGGRFVGDRELTLRGTPEEAHPDHPARGLRIVEGVAAPQRSSGEVPNAEWSGRDQSGRLVFTKEGSIFARSDAEDAEDVEDIEDIELVSFALERPEPCPPPEWATRPLTRP